jgi:nitrogen fixation/metabolism regulation signal transduction histidine kinase
MKLRLKISLRLRFFLYLVFIHLLFAGVAIYLLSKHRFWLLAVEAVFVISLAAGASLIRNLFGAIELINTGARFIEDSDFTSRFREVGQPEMDHLAHVYNRMADSLREERARMQEQNYFLDKVLTASPSGVVTFDFDGRIATVNPTAERMLQYGRADLIGKRLDELNSAFAQSLDDIKAGESRIVPLLGQRRVKCRRSQFLDRGFTREFILVDELTEELRQAEKTAYEKVIRMMSHEVNNSVGSANSLLHSCLHYSDRLLGEDRLDFETALNIVLERTDRLNVFMRNIADVFRLPPPNLQPCDVRSLIEDVAFLFKAECARLRSEIVWDARTKLEPVRLDRSQMEQVFVNVLKNAIEAIDDIGAVTIRLGKQAGRGFVVIEDTGCGIAPSARANLFTPFFSTKDNGQGIGLTLAREILDQHGFEFSLESQPGRPTEFTIYF